MANENKAIAWLLSQSDRFDIKIEELSWIKRLFPGWTDICCSLTFGARSIVAWGAADSSDLALCKAFSEAAERGVFLTTASQTTNGFASHLDRDFSRANAAFELIERDLFLCHFLTQTPFDLISKTELEMAFWFRRAQMYAEELKLRLRYYYLGATGVLAVVDGLESQLSCGFIVGTSFRSHFLEAALSATIEVMRRANFISKSRSNGESIDLSLQEFLNLSQPKFSDHGRLGLNLEYAQKIRYLFPDQLPTSAGKRTTSSLNVDRIKLSDLQWPYPHSNGSSCPFYFAQAESVHSQNLFLGRPTEKVVNITRLQAFKLDLTGHHFDTDIKTIPPPPVN
jgi:hypothetical protein